MEVLNNLAFGFSHALTLQNLMFCALGCTVGTLVGLLPGLGPLATISLLLPLTYSIDTTGALIMLAGIYYGAQYGDSVSAITMKIPHASSIVACIDGYAMTLKGKTGLALFTAEQRTKEIGVRKVLGASVSGIVFMLSKDFLKLVLIANLIALPLGWYLMGGWLNDFADRTEMSWWIFAAAFVSTVIIATLTLCFHAIRTAVANPVTSLRTE